MMRFVSLVPHVLSCLPSRWLRDIDEESECGAFNEDIDEDVK
jgi:hypothetical protein